jgi:hypothetical protein
MGYINYPFCINFIKIQNFLYKKNCLQNYLKAVFI